MEGEASKRSWWRLHALTWAAVLLVGVGVVVANLYGEYEEIGYLAVSTVHGWPFAYLMRIPPLFGSFVQPPSRWPFAWDFVESFNIAMLVLNAVIAVVVLLCTGFMTELYCRNQRAAQFSLAGILSATVLAAMSFAAFKAGYFDVF